MESRGIGPSETAEGQGCNPVGTSIESGRSFQRSSSSSKMQMMIQQVFLIPHFYEYAHHAQDVYSLLFQRKDDWWPLTKQIPPITRHTLKSMATLLLICSGPRLGHKHCLTKAGIWNNERKPALNLKDLTLI